MASSTVSTSFTEATRQRRTVRTLQNTSSVPDSTIMKVCEEALHDIPSAFNSQTTRITVLFGDEHKKLWDITGKALLNKIGEERWNGGTKDRIALFGGAYGSILFWNDQASAAGLSQNAPDIYKDKTDEWVHQSSGMHQYYVWTALSALGLGANLQHYNPLIDDEVKKTWNVAADWTLSAQLVFGIPKEGAGPDPKQQKLSIEERLQVYGV